ncbi:Elongation factor P--(R)-beta-lysine ligase [Gammaproteobacteria bacterium]
MNIYLRAKTLAKIRDFFATRNVTEVETPLLSHSTNPAPHLNSFCLDDLYLQTSPEFAMKRLLAAGSGDIYQICKAFRESEIGRLHNPEFTILEWYRIGFDHHALMDEVNEFLKVTIDAPEAKRFTYEEIFAKFLKINPHESNVAQLKIVAQNNDLSISVLSDDHDTWLQLLFTHLIEPKLGQESPVFVYDFPVSQAMLAKVRSGKPPVASRFEVYFKGIELANGFHELSDAIEQRKRFLHDLAERQELNLSPIPLDENFLLALQNLPDCSGVALGVDRLLLLVANAFSLNEILCYPFSKG